MKNRKSIFSAVVYAVIFLCTYTVDPAKAQISEGGVPPSFSYTSSLKSTPVAVQVPLTFSVEDLKTVNAWKVSQGAPLAISKIIDTRFHLIEDGNAGTLPGGEKIYRLRIQAKGALALMLYYSAFYIPEGGKLFIYNATKTHVLGAYTSRTNPATARFATEFVAGDDIILEYIEAPSGEKPRIEIDKIGYGYDHLNIVYNSGSEISGPCMVNINCEEGNEWQTQKKGICWMLEIIGDDGYVCSGSLVNNTAQDMKPYILSAYHCTDGKTTQEEFDQWVFYFNFEYNGCPNGSDIAPYRTLVGCSQVAYSPVDKGSDGLLLLLHQNIPDNYDVFFNGWDRTNTPAQSGVGIHHPGGDFKKISTYGNVPVISTTWTNSTSNETGISNAHWLVIFDQTPNGYSVTEGGSSGSPMFNENKLIVGTLSGGNSSCDAPDGINLYGKLFYHWNKFGGSDHLRMDKWLDPLQTGATVLNGISRSGEKTPVVNYYMAPLDVSVTGQTGGSSSLKWKAPVYKKSIGWVQNGIYGYYGFEGTPFYFAQRWEPTDLKNFNKKILSVVSFWPVEKATYAIYIRQGDRTYEQDVTKLTLGSMNTISLRSPFVIDATKDLIVGCHVKKYDQYAAVIDNGPLHYKKGHLYSEDGKQWEYATKEELDNNVVVYATVTSEEGEVPLNRSISEKSGTTFTKSSKFKPSIQKLKSTEIVPMENQSLDAFPEITGYTIYRNNRLLATLPGTQTQYTDKETAGEDAVYQVAALYGETESSLITAIAQSSQGNATIEADEIDIYPSVFTDQVRIKNHEKVKRLDIYSINGKKITSIPAPEETLNTAHLPHGGYIFQLHGDKGIKNIRALKQ